MRLEEIRKRVLEDWRGLPEELPRPERCVLAANALKKLLNKLGLAERLSEREIQTAWREIVGEFLAQHSNPVSMRDGVLVVQVIQPSVRYELDRSWKQSILRKLQERFDAKTVREVRFRG
jgi:predicted nucleic acid-binding Zn ribbon protein